VVQQRHQLGHWESDTVIARHCKAALHVAVERKTRLTKITKLDGCTRAGHTLCAQQETLTVSQSGSTNDYL
jgi:IS30 family transposase